MVSLILYDVSSRDEYLRRRAFIATRQNVTVQRFPDGFNMKDRTHTGRISFTAAVKYFIHRNSLRPALRASPRVRHRGSLNWAEDIYSFPKT